LCSQCHHHIIISSHQHGLKPAVSHIIALCQAKLVSAMHGTMPMLYIIALLALWPFNTKLEPGPSLLLIVCICKANASVACWASA
jgi:hypothetical protein